MQYESCLVHFRQTFKTTTEDNYLGVLPFYHIYGMAPVLLGALQDGAYMTTISKFDPEMFLTAIQKQKVHKNKSRVKAGLNETNCLKRFNQHKKIFKGILCMVY